MDKATAAADVLQTDTIGIIVTAVARCVAIVAGLFSLGLPRGLNPSREDAHGGRRKLTRGR
jgi:hypothetical protein